MDADLVDVLFEEENVCSRLNTQELGTQYYPKSRNHEEMLIIGI